MKKTTLLIVTLLFGLIISAQTNSTPVINLDSGLGYTAQIDITETEVTLTLVGPSSGYLGLGFGVNSMTVGGDVIIYDGTSISDRTFQGVGVTPTPDTNDWTTVSDNVSGGMRTVVGTRSLTTADANDYVFNTTDTSIMLVWAHRPNSFALAYHGFGTKGATTAGFTLSNPEFNTPTKFSIFPNPGSDVMNINVPSITNDALQLEVFDVLGKRVYSENLSDLNTKVNISKWNSGLYLVRLTSPNEDIKLTKRFVKL